MKTANADDMKKKYRQIIEWFQANMPAAESELNFNSPYQLIVAVILSAQCTDKRVNLTTPVLFGKYPTVSDLAKANEEEIFELIRSISYPNNKSKHLLAMAQKVVNNFGGEIPSAIDDLVTLPGVGRKTANVVASVLYNEPVIAVDTHVFRVSHRIGLSAGKTPLAVEKDLEDNIEESLRPIAHHWLILHGRYVCTARNPHCDKCGISQYCGYYAKNN